MKSDTQIHIKLVRDKIPEIIADSGATFETRVLNSDVEYAIELAKKLQEEVVEFITSGDIEELADIEEVLRAILDLRKVSYEEFENIRNKKVEQRGAFKDRLFLIYTKK